jgi:hypothetical protein
MRRYVLWASVGPVAFGLCSIISAAAAVLISDRILHLTLLNEPLNGSTGLMIAFVIYITPGILGAWLAVSLAGRLKARLSK